MLFKQAIINFQKNPKRLFLIDGIGALLSSFLLGIVLVKLESLFGIPTSTLYILAVLPLFFVVFDFYSYRKNATKYSINLKGIAILNMSYSILSLSLAFLHYESITSLGWTYIIVEILILCALSMIEFKVARRLI